MIRRFCAVAAVMLASVLFALSSQAQVIQGTVTDRNTNAPLAGVTVQAGCGSVSTDASGNYSLLASQVCQSSGYLYFRVQNYYVAYSTYDLSGGIPQQINQSLLNGGVLLQGVVSDATTQAPISGATITFVADHSYQQPNSLTGPDGSYSFDASYFYEPAATGFTIIFGSVTASGYVSDNLANLSFSPPFPVAKNLQMIPTGGVAIQGTVTDRNTSAPLAGVTVQAACGSVSTDVNGSYSFSGSQACQSSGYLYFRLRNYYVAYSTYDLSGGIPQQINQSLLNGGVLLQGVVSDATTQAPISGATITFVADHSYQQPNLLTGPDGSYSFDASYFYEPAATGFTIIFGSVTATAYVSDNLANLSFSPPFPVTKDIPLFSGAPYANITVTTSPVGVPFTVDGNVYTSAHTFQWPTGSTHTLSTTSPRPIAAGSQYAFNSWSDGGAITHTISSPASSTTLTANFNLQYQLTTAANPPAGGSTAPASGWFNAGPVVVTATPNSGYAFTGFSGALSGTTNPQTLTLNAPASVTAQFAVPTTNTSLASSQNPVAYGQTVTFTASVTSVSGTPSSGNVTFTDGATTLAVVPLVPGGTAAYSTSSLSTGVHSIVASYGGNTTFAPSSSAPVNESVSPVASSTVITSSSNPSVFNQPVTFTATVTPAFGGPASGSVTFLDNGAPMAQVPLSGNVAQLVVSSLTRGSHVITASYSGDANVGASTAKLTQTVNKAPTTTTVTGSPNPASIGQAVTFTATVAGKFGGNATGTVTFKRGTTLLATVPLSGNVATFSTSTLPAVSNTITAMYSGDANYQASNGNVVEKISKYASSTAVNSSLNPSNFGQPVTFTATVSSANGTPTGTVTFKNGTSSLGTVALSGGVATLTTSSLAVGTRSITAVYSGDPNFAVSTSPLLSQVVKKAPTTTTLTSSQNPSATGQAVTFTATVVSSTSGIPTGTVTFKNGTTVLATVSLTGGSASVTTSALTTGTHNITATYNGTASYATSSASMSQVVN